MNAEPASTHQPLIRGLAAVILPTLIVGFLSFVYQTLDDKRKDQLQFARDQVSELYGPLYTLSEANDFVWSDLSKDHIPHWDPPTPALKGEVALWRNMVTTVVGPMNAQLENTLLSSKQIIRCSDTVAELHALVLFSEYVKLLISTWKSDADVGDVSKTGNLPSQRYPNMLSRLLLRDLDRARERERTLDNGFLGLFAWIAPPPDCVPLPPAAQ